jgi:type VI secretion system protein ImpC
MSSGPPGGRGVSFSIGAAPRRAEPARPIEAALHVLVAADCSGRAGRGVREPLGARRAQRVDVDRWDDVVASWRARVETPLCSAAGEPVWLEPRSLDDLHPDRLLQNVPVLAELVALLKKVDSDPSAAARLEALIGSAAAAPSLSLADAGATASGSASASAPAETGADTLARLLGGAAASAPARSDAAKPSAPAKVDLDQFIRAIIGSPPAAKPEASVDRRALTAAAEAELARRLRLILASPALRALEATWRGIDGLCRECPDEARVHLSVLDASFEEIVADPAGLSSCLESSAATVLLVDHHFSAEAEPLRALSALIDVCQARDVELLAAAHPHLAGCAHFAEVSQPEKNAWALPDDASAAWANALRARERGARFSLALPRFCLRQPYGASGEPLEHFRFEEILDPADHEAFLWGNGAYLLARAIGIRHANANQGLHPDGSLELRELPVIHLEDDAESRLKPCAESWLSERSLGRLRAGGFSVLLGLRDTDRVRIYF